MAAYNISNEDLHEFFKLHNQMSDGFNLLSNKVMLIGMIKNSCVELEAYKNKNYEMLCMEIAELQNCCEKLNETAEKCNVHMNAMMKDEKEDVDKPILDKLFFGEIEPHLSESKAETLLQNEKQLGRHTRKLYDTLDEEQKNLLSNIEEDYLNIQTCNQLTSFKEGYKIAVKSIFEGLELNSNHNHQLNWWFAQAL